MRFKLEKLLTSSILFRVIYSLWFQYRIPLTFIKIISNFRLKQSPPKIKVLGQIAEDYTHYLRLFQLKNLWSDADFDWLIVRGNRHLSKGFKSKLGDILFRNRFTDLKWSLLFTKTLGGKVVFRNISQWHDQDEVASLVSELQKQVTSKDDLVNVSFRGIQIGDLVYDSYLRFKPAAVVDIADPYLEHMFTYCVNIFLNFEKHLSKNKYDWYISTYSTYIDHGIAVRLCLKNNIRVMCTGNFNQVLVELKPQFPYHKRNFHLYKSWVNESNKKTLIDLGKDIMGVRFSGKIDTVTSYMKTSAFHHSSESTRFDKNEKKCIVMAHDFFDSPHVYGEMLFSDYYSWLDFVLATASTSTEYKYYIKPHPNAVKDSVQFYEELKLKYPNVIFIDPSVSNIEIMNSNFRCAFTLIGTVAHEFPYGGIPTVTAGENPHSAFDFCYQAKSREELKNIILNPESISSDISKEEIEIFVGVHNYRLYKYELMTSFPWISTANELYEAMKDTSKNEIRKKIMEEEVKNLNYI